MLGPEPGIVLVTPFGGYCALPLADAFAQFQSDAWLRDSASTAAAAVDGGDGTGGGYGGGRGGELAPCGIHSIRE